MAAEVRKHLPAALRAEGIEALAALLLHRVALGVVQLVAADQGVSAIAVWRDAFAGEHSPHHLLPRIRRLMPCTIAVLASLCQDQPCRRIRRWATMGIANPCLP